MRHKLRGKQLSRDSEHRKALQRSLTQSLIEHGSIKTTTAKAKYVQNFVEKVITVARDAVKSTDAAVKLNARRKVISMINDRRLVDEKQDFIVKGQGDRSVVEKLFNEVAPAYVSRPGGYTRIIKLPNWRIGDAGDVVKLELVEKTSKPTGTARKSAGLRRKKAEKKFAFAGKALKTKEAAPEA
jgi:large subunit ribosomal protein L17